MKKKIISFVMMFMVALAIMPVCTIHAEEISENITLTADRTEQIKIPAGSTVTLDLAGYNLTVESVDAIINYGSLTIVDSGREVDGSTVYGTVTSTSNNTSALSTTPGSTTVIKGGSFTGYWYVIRDLGTMVIDNGTFTSQTSGSNGGNAAMIHVGYDENSADKIDDITYSDSPTPSTVSLTVNGGTFDITNSTSTMCIKSVGFSKLVVNGGTFSGQSCIKAWYDTTINGGLFTATEEVTHTGVVNAVIQNCADNREYNSETSWGVEGSLIGKMIINGGTFKNADSSKLAYTSQYFGPTTTIYGGTFTGKIEQVNGPKNEATYGTVNIYGGTFTTESDISSYILGESTTNDGIITVSTSSISSITKYVIYNSAPTDTEFTYTISNIKGDDVGDTVLQEASTTDTTTFEEVRDGITPSKVKFTNTGTGTTTLGFNINDFNSGALVSSLASPTLAAEDGSKYVSKAFTVDFSDVTWVNPGIFRYVVKETTNNEKVPSSGNLYFDVWVARQSSIQGTDDYNKFNVTAVIAHTDNSLEYNTNTKAIGDKTSYLTSTSRMKAMNLTVKHYADGNQASKTEEYTYTLNLAGATRGSTITWIKSDGTQGSITVDSAGAYTYKFKLKASEYVVFQSISEDPAYTVTADEATMKAETLTTVTSIEQDNSTGTLTDSDTKTDDLGTNVDIVLSPQAASATNISDSKYEIADTYMQQNTTVAFTIYKVGTIPTGVIVSVAPYACVALAGFAGIITFAAKKRRKEDEDE